MAIPNTLVKILNGKILIKKVYVELRASDHWNDTVLLITYDEHGGFYDKGKLLIVFFYI